MNFDRFVGLPLIVSEIYMCLAKIRKNGNNSSNDGNYHQKIMIIFVK